MIIGSWDSIELIVFMGVEAEGKELEEAVGVAEPVEIRAEGYAIFAVGFEVVTHD